MQSSSQRSTFVATPLLVVLILLSQALASAYQGTPGLQEGAGITAIVGGTILDPGSGPAFDDAVILVEGRRILQAGSAADIELPPEATIIDASGGFLLPGFIEAHTHVGMGPVLVSEVDGAPAIEMAHDPEVAQRSLPLILAHGITTALDPGGPTDVLLDLRDRVREGGLTGPDLRVAGYVIDGTPFPGLTATVATPKDVIREVMRQADAGVDFIKLYATLSPEHVAAGVAAAEARGDTGLIHPFLATWTEAARLGVDAVLHISPGSLDLVFEAARNAMDGQRVSPDHQKACFVREEGVE